MLAIFRTGEDYEGLNSALEDLVAEVNRLKTIELDGKSLWYRIPLRW